MLLENFYNAGGKTVRIEKMQVPDRKVSEVESRVEGSFDIKSINSSLASRMTDEFNYIGLVCSAIVFIFLWYSFSNIRLAILAFIPMAVSWIWILGIMGMTGIQFNIVNIILATFIFGQGDDYTIFMAEGCRYEHATGKPMLASYKSSIILSALIMFAGIGVLVFASHPAMYSLGIVTVVGMASVVLMSFVVTPVLYRLLFKRNI
ncbi:MAG: MMPL family transporter [Bacteroidaceae bacterium]|nr:MMPL family transporter [Bacteroidaceae bacterium]